MPFKKLFIICLALCAMFMFASCSYTLSAEESENSSSEEIEYTEDYYDRLFLGEVVTEEEKRENIFAALTEININTEFIKEFQKIEDETEGEKYSFIYRDNPFTVTMEPDSTVASVRIGEDGTDVYLKGYESYDADDYIMTEGIITSFKYGLINAVEICFDYPSVYEFADDWTYKHEGDFYYSSGTVLIGEAKKEHSMSLTRYYEAEENTMHWYSLKVDGKEVSIPKEFKEPEITERQPASGE